MEKYLDRKGFELNVRKTKVMRFRKGMTRRMNLKIEGNEN